MWKQGASWESLNWQRGTRPAEMRKASLQILPCTVSQLLSACPAHNEVFTIQDLELNQVSIVGTVRGSSSFATYDQFFVDDMTGPPLTVRQWNNTEGKKSLLAMDIRCVKDSNEITSHMLEVVYAHMQLFGKGCDANMNVLSVSDGAHISDKRYVEQHGLSIIQGQVMHVIKQHSVNEEGISFHDLTTQLDNIGIKDIRESLAFLINEGHVFSTVDENHFKSTEH